MINFDLLCLLGNFLAVTMSFGIALFVFLTLPKTRINIFFTILNLFIGLWCLAPVLVNLTFISHKLLIERIGYIFAIFLVPIFFEIVYSTNPQPKLQTLKLIMYFISYSLLLFLNTDYFINDLIQVHTLYQPKPGPVYYFFTLYFALGIGISVHTLRKTLLKYKTNAEKLYTTTIVESLLYGYGLEYLAGIIYFGTTLRIIPLYTFAGYFVGAGGFVLFFAILKHGFLIDSEVKQNAFQDYITETSKRLIELKDPKELSKYLDNLLKRNTDCLEAVVFCLQENVYKDYLHPDQVLSINDPLIEILISQHKMIYFNDAVYWAEKIRTPNFMIIHNFFTQNQIKLISPLFFGDLIGFICIKPKRNGTEYTDGDMKIFDLINYSTSIALQNILLLTGTTKDGLTKLYNKVFFNKQIEEMITLSIKNNNHFALLFFDVDNFSKMNEALGHLKCDEKLKDLGALMMDQFRVEDVLARWGGEEFAIILPRAQKEDMHPIAGKLLKKIETSLNITVSCGIAFFDSQHERYKNKNITEIKEMLIEEADNNMYEAKKQGKNQVFWKDTN